MRAAREMSKTLRNRQSPPRGTSQPLTSSSATGCNAGTADGGLLWPLLFPYRPPRRLPSGRTLLHEGITTRDRSGNRTNAVRAAAGSIDAILMPPNGDQDVAARPN